MEKGTDTFSYLRVTYYFYDGWDTAKPTPIGNENFDLWCETNNFSDYTFC